jgi:hypothetical protein
MCGPSPSDQFKSKEQHEQCTHGVSLAKACIMCEDEYINDDPLCDHDTKPTGERDEEDRKITQCKHCGKEFVQLHAPKKEDDATDS